ncbi:MAG: M1 family aminopeptidase [Kyrpidia sp.]|nr:M1 family aminopeptidase [Kyrpidia sp.]
MFRWWVSWALALVIAAGSTALVVKSAAFPDRSWADLAGTAAARIHRAAAAGWSTASASRPPDRNPERPFPGDSVQAPPTTYTLRAAFEPDTHRIRGEETVEWNQPLPNPVHFYLYPQGAGGIHIRGVRRDGQSLSFHTQGEQLTVDAPGEGPRRLTIDFVTDIPTASSRYGDLDGVWVLSYWYPILAARDGRGWIAPPEGKGFGEPYVVDTANYRVTWTAPAGMTWYASAPATSDAPGPDGRTTLTMEGQHLRHFALVGSARYQNTTLDLPGGPRVHLGLLDPGHQSRIEATATRAVNTYRARFGKLPYSDVALVETPSGSTFAQELPNLALIDVDLWNGLMPEQDADHWTAHELAHLWWYNAVGDYEGLTPWLDEGLADFSAYLYQESRYGPTAYDEAMNRLATWFKEGRSYSPGDPGSPLPSAALGATDRPYADFDTEWQYYVLEYLRPVLMYRDLRRSMGDDRFFRWLRTLYEQHLGRVVTAAQWRESLKAAAPDQTERADLWLDAPNEDLVRRLDDAGDLRFGRPGP